MTGAKEAGAAGEMLEVRYGDKLVGVIRRRSEEIQDIEFEYDEAWTKDPEAFAVSTRMPLASRMHEPGVVYRWFLNILPEGRTLQTVGTILKIPEADVFALLEELGEDLPGALEIHPPAAQQRKRNPRYKRLSEAELAAVIRRLPERPFLVGEDGMHMSLAGAQDKLPVVQYPDGAIGLALDGAPTTHILKPTNRRLNYAVENEAFCLRLAAKIKIPVAECSVGKAEDVDYLLVKRYDRVPHGRSLRRVHQEDFCQATGHIPSTKYETNPATKLRGPTLKDCFEIIRKTDAGALNAGRFLDYFVFNVLCGNVDAHAKNYSLLLLPGGSVTMTPLYDVMNGDIYPDVTRNLAMKIAGKNRGHYIYARHWNRMAEENGLSGAQVRRRVGELSQAVLDALPSVVEERNAELKSAVYKQISEYIAGYCRDMLRNLKNDPEAEPEQADDMEEAAPRPGFS